MNFTVNDLMLSVDTSLTSFTGLSSDGVYTMESVGSVLSNGVSEVGLRFSIFPVLSLTDNSLLGINVGDSIPSVISQRGVVLAVPVKQSGHSRHYMQRKHNLLFLEPF